MSSNEFVLRANSDRFNAPPESPCPNCGKSLTGADGVSVAYLSGGAIPISPCGGHGRIGDPLISFLSVGVISELKENANVEIPIVDCLKHEQFSLEWCSLECMRDWFLKLFDEIERQSLDQLSQPKVEGGTDSTLEL